MVGLPTGVGGLDDPLAVWQLPADLPAATRRPSPAQLFEGNKGAEGPRPPMGITGPSAARRDAWKDATSPGPTSSPSWCPASTTSSRSSWSSPSGSTGFDPGEPVRPLARARGCNEALVEHLRVFLRLVRRRLGSVGRLASASKVCLRARLGHLDQPYLDPPDRLGDPPGQGPWNPRAQRGFAIGPLGRGVSGSVPLGPPLGVPGAIAPPCW